MGVILYSRFFIKSRNNLCDRVVYFSFYQTTFSCINKQVGLAMHCQQCHLPLEIDRSLTLLTRAQTHLLTSGKLGHGKHPIPPSAANTNIDNATSHIPEGRKNLLERALRRNAGAEALIKQDAADSYVILPQFRDEDLARPTTQKQLQQQKQQHEKQQQQQYVEEEEEIMEEEEIGRLSNRMQSLSAIFNILSSRSDIDYPVCRDCAVLLLQGMKTQYERASGEREVYLQFLQKLENRQTPLVDKTKESLDEIEQLKAQELIMLEELQKLEAEKDELDNEMQQVQNELQAIEKEEFELLKLENQKELKELELIEERDALKSQRDYLLAQLHHLRKTNVHNDTFHISHEGPFGTINSLRLGSLPNNAATTVPWQEINAALGQVILLIATVCTRLDIKLRGFRLKPMGSTSKIDKLETDSATGEPTGAVQGTLNVYASGDGNAISRLFTHSQFDESMVSLLDIMAQIEQRLKSYDQGIELPYLLDGETIGGIGIRGGESGGANWTGACKFLLTNLKWVLAYSSAHAKTR